MADCWRESALLLYSRIQPFRICRQRPSKSGNTVEWLTPNVSIVTLKSIRNVGAISHRWRDGCSNISLGFFWTVNNPCWAMDAVWHLARKVDNILREWEWVLALLSIREIVTLKDVNNRTVIILARSLRNALQWVGWASNQAIVLEGRDAAQLQGAPNHLRT